MFLTFLVTLQQIQVYAIVIFFILIRIVNIIINTTTLIEIILTENVFKVTVCNIRCADCIIRGLFVRTIQSRRWLATTTAELSVVVEVPVVRTDRVL